jgi:hypothetical protein
MLRARRRFAAAFVVSSLASVASACVPVKEVRAPANALCAPAARPIAKASPPPAPIAPVDRGFAKPPPSALAATPEVAPLVAADTSGAKQLYCNGSCSWAGGQGCDRSDADVFCRLLTEDPDARAVSFEVATALDAPGFACPMDGTSYGQNLGARPDLGIGRVVFETRSVRATHGPGDVIVNVRCSVPSPIAR